MHGVMRAPRRTGPRRPRPTASWLSPRPASIAGSPSSARPIVLCHRTGHVTPAPNKTTRGFETHCLGPRILIVVYMLIETRAKDPRSHAAGPFAPLRPAHARASTCGAFRGEGVSGYIRGHRVASPQLHSTRATRASTVLVIRGGNARTREWDRPAASAPPCARHPGSSCRWRIVGGSVFLSHARTYACSRLCARSHSLDTHLQLPLAGQDRTGRHVD